MNSLISKLLRFSFTLVYPNKLIGTANTYQDLLNLVKSWEVMSLKQLLCAVLVMSTLSSFCTASPTPDMDHQQFAGKTEESTHHRTPPTTPFQSLQLQGPEYIYLVMRSQESIRDFWPPLLTIAMFYNPATQVYHEPAAGGYRIEDGVTYRINPPLAEILRIAVVPEGGGDAPANAPDRYTQQLMGWAKEVETTQKVYAKPLPVYYAPFDRVTARNVPEHYKVTQRRLRLFTWQCAVWANFPEIWANVANGDVLAVHANVLAVVRRSTDGVRASRFRKLFFHLYIKVGELHGAFLQRVMQYAERCSMQGNEISEDELNEQKLEGLRWHASYQAGDELIVSYTQSHFYSLIRELQLAKAGVTLFCRT